MATNADQDPDLERLKNMPIRTEEIGFSPDEMVACAKCGKPNAPNRAACLYCGTEIEGSGLKKLNARELESWEKGFNVIILDAAGADIDRASAELSTMLGAAAGLIKDILRSGRPVPLARLESESLAEKVVERLARGGIKTRVVADESLRAESRPVRLRSIVFDEDGLRLRPFNPGPDQILARADLALIAIGVNVEDRLESLERRKKREAKTLNESQFSHDEPVIDIYSKHDPCGWRIPASGFDFSCLGDDKALLATENMRQLVVYFAEFSPAVKIVGDYAELRSLMEPCWPSESRKDAQRMGFARKDVASVVVTSNAVQWTKYSRLQWHLL